MAIKRFAGVDFSGAQDAGKHIWLCACESRAGRLVVTELLPAADLPGGSVTRAAAVSALRDNLAARSGTLAGLDFPPGLPRAVMRHTTWADMVRHFAGDYPDAEAFRERCRLMTDGREIRRKTDIEALTPFCVYNLRLYRQTYYGLRDVIAPLMMSETARVLPMQKPHPGKVLLVESCPASTLKALHLYAPYKGKNNAMRDARRWLIESIIGQWPVDISRRLRDMMIENSGGDALDAFLAAFGIWAYVRAGRPLMPQGDAYAVEGYVYAPGLRNTE